MPATIAQFRECLSRVRESVATVHGFLTRRETEALAALAAFPKAAGDILEIGSLRGKSAIALALASKLADDRFGRTTVHAVDPLPDVGPMAPDANGKPSAEVLLRKNLAAADVADRVEVHKLRSHDLAANWRRPLRLLWIDGMHKYPAVDADFTDYWPHLVDGGVVAFHDVLNPIYDGPLRVFMERVLADDRFWPAHLCGSIGWARYNAAGIIGAADRRAKERLGATLGSLMPLQQPDLKLAGIARLKYRWRRMRVPHGGFDVGAWREQAA